MSFASSNGPDSPPVLYNPSNNNNAVEENDGGEGERCRFCHAAAMYTDWAQGDRVCTNCGVVAEGHLVDTGPEWKDFNDAEDLVKGLPSAARSGLVAVDESKYLGGLQPTTLSKHSFGGESSGGFGAAMIRKRLRSTNRKLDHMMEKIQVKALTEAKLDRRIRLKRSREQRDHQSYDDSSASASIRPEMDNLVLQEEEEAQRLHAALYAEKWSLDRAMVLHGLHHEQRHVSDEERENLQNSLDETTRKASQDLYKAYSMLKHAASTLQLPDRVMMDASHRLVRFVTKRDGFRIAGVGNRLTASHDSFGTVQERKEATKEQGEVNLHKQMAAVAAALLFMTARSLGWARSHQEISSCFPLEHPNRTSNEDKNEKIMPCIKGKHVSRAMKEIQKTLPDDFRQSTSSAANQELSVEASQDAATTANFVEHALRKLQLPPVAEASITALVLGLRIKQVHSGDLGEVKLPTLCAGIAYFVCNAGAAMQRLAQQHQQTLREDEKSFANQPTDGDFLVRKTVKSSSKRKHSQPVADSQQAGVVEEVRKKDGDTSTSLKRARIDEDIPFDVFSHPAVFEDRTEMDAYELKRMWHAWIEQIPWARSVVELEQSCGVSRRVIADFYRFELYPRRDELLKFLSTAVLQKPESGQGDPRTLCGTPMAALLMTYVGMAVGVMQVR